MKWTEEFIFLVINDGSTDGTTEILTRLREQFGPRLEVISRENRGHGQSCLQGYRIACDRNIPYVLQLDSDGQCDPQFFFRFWRLREKHDVIYGFRFRRDDGWRRVLASWVLRLTLLANARVWCIDANVPYRLMRTDILKAPLEDIDCNFVLANIALAVLLRKSPIVRHGVVPIRFRERYGGEPTLKVSQFGVRAVELCRQLKKSVSRKN